LERFAGSDDSTLRQRVADNHRAGSELALRCLARDPDNFVRGAVAARPDLSLELLAPLAADSFIHVRCAVARNRDVPVVLLAQLSGDLEKGFSWRSLRTRWLR
jgi:hypothetical protein